MKRNVHFPVFVFNNYNFHFGVLFLTQAYFANVKKNFLPKNKTCFELQICQQKNKFEGFFFHSRVQRTPTDSTWLYLTRAFPESQVCSSASPGTGSDWFWVTVSHHQRQKVRCTSRTNQAERLFAWPTRVHPSAKNTMTMWLSTTHCKNTETTGVDLGGTL